MKNCFSKFTKKNLKLNLINKFTYQNSKKIPDLKKISLNFNGNNKNKMTNFKGLAIHALALKDLTNQKSAFVFSKKTNTHLKIRKKHPVNVKILLRRRLKHVFAIRIITDVFLKNKNLHLSFSKKNTFSMQNLNNLNFAEIENNFHLFQKLSNLNVTYVTSALTLHENALVLKFFKVPLL